MKTISLLVLASLSFLSSCVTMPKADFRKSIPTVVLLDVAPGYIQTLSLNIPDNGVIELGVAMINQNPSQKWAPTAFVALHGDDSEITYGVEITTNANLQKQYVHTRVIGTKDNSELSSNTHQGLFSISSENTLKIVISGKNIRSFVNNTIVEERQLAFEPTSYAIGASSGSYKLTIIEAPPPPSSE
ncbi:hypothetical protein ACTJIL_09625 [Luteimonas sp. 22616]|uniref:hypothetical protein n=1 Tax=Luteimonas sp. 22616 TaxID=3453951 RepID=UPI003F869634